MDPECSVTFSRLAIDFRSSKGSEKGRLERTENVE